MPRRLLLVSSSVVHGYGYLDHAEAEVRDLFAGVPRVLFVPHALADRDVYAARAGARFAAMGLQLDSLHAASDPVSAVEHASGVFVGGGNTFRLLKALEDLGVLDPLRRRVQEGMPYMGSSAGSNVAAPTIRTTNDMPIVEPRSFAGLGLVPFQINPHYLDADPGSTHMGETREERLLQYLEENDRPVAALREGAMLRVRDGSYLVTGIAGVRLFRRGADPVELPPGSSLESYI